MPENLIKDLIPEQLVNGRDSEHCDVLPELTEEELLLVVQQARWEKAARLRRQAYAEQLRKAPEYWRPTAQEYLDDLLAQNPDFKVDEQNEQVFVLLAQYFTRDVAFEQEGLSLGKGIMLAGPVGCGKTMLLRLFRVNPYMSYLEISCQRVTNEFAKGGFSVIEQYIGARATEADVFGHLERGYFFDDLGTDEERGYYGNMTNVMGDILRQRYDSSVPYYMTHITTNLTGDQLLQVYGTRLASRMRGMFNVLSFPQGAKDRRG